MAEEQPEKPNAQALRMFSRRKVAKYITKYVS
jgi:hypothetical protein